MTTPLRLHNNLKAAWKHELWQILRLGIGVDQAIVLRAVRDFLHTTDDVPDEVLIAALNGTCAVVFCDPAERP